MNTLPIVERYVGLTCDTGEKIMICIVCGHKYSDSLSRATNIVQYVDENGDDYYTCTGECARKQYEIVKLQSPRVYDFEDKISLS